MENKSTPPTRKGKGISKKLKKIIAFFTCVVLIFVSVFIYCVNNYEYGYKYYQTFENNSIMIGQTLVEDFLQTNIQHKLDMLENDGYLIASYTLDNELVAKQAIVHKPSAENDKDLGQIIQDSTNVDVLLIQLTIDGDDNTYYFKTDEACNTFVSELKEISSKVDTTSEGTVGSYKLVSSQDDLKLAEQALQKKVDAEKAAEAAARKAAQAQVTSRGSTTSRSSSSSSYDAPMASYVYISSEYGPRWGRQHTGVDFAASAGTSVYAWKSGTVTMAQWNGSYGNFIEIDHEDGTVSRYAHLSGYNISAGQQVSQGQTIGYVGSTGNSTGNHLHFEIKVNGSFVNPLNYL